jgi:hypothetical protein
MPLPAPLRILYAATFAFAGFLLFQVQPMLAKYILPWFGGSATTWIVCMLFFQVALLAGYGYAYALTRPLSVARQAKAQIFLLAIGAALLPITPSDAWKPADVSDPTLRIVALLAASVGLPYLILSTTSPLLSRWLARLDRKLDPGRFFAASNLGSFVGLLSYPFVFERVMGTGEQTVWWSWAFVVYALLFGACAIIAMRHKEAPAEPGAAGAILPEARDAPGRWIAYAAMGSILLLATTNAITQWSAVIPFLWILPLSLYLLTFVIAFGHRRLYGRAWACGLFLLLAAATLLMARPETSADFLDHLAVQCATMFVGCLICHCEMAALQPEPARLPKFYLAIAFGGALGGILVALVAPLVFSDYYEHQIVLIAIAALSFRLMLKSAQGARAPRLIAFAMLALFCGGLAWAAWIGVEANELIVARVRNFYGVVKVVKEDVDDPEEYSLAMVQAGVEQGSQYQLAAKKMVPACAFDWNSGVGLALANQAKRRAGGPQAPLRIGIVGLGAGMVATLGRAGDVIRYYELNPAVLDLANRHFSFVRDGRATTQVLLGDGRLTLERELAAGQKQEYDVLVMNAFRGASPPVHLMTKEAFDLYLAQLAPNGVLAVNFELDTFEMAPLHRGMASLFGLDVGWFETQHRSDDCDDPISWALYSYDKGFFAAPPVKAALSPWRDDGTSKLVWTDRSNNLMSIINWSPVD